MAPLYWWGCLMERRVDAMVDVFDDEENLKMYFVLGDKETT